MQNMAAGPSSCYERKVSYLIRRREWDEVLAYYNRMRCPDAKMNSKGDTVLHLAVSDRLLDILDKLLFSLQHDSSTLERVLIAKNENGDTPLHIAASSRYANYCFSIISSFGRTGKPVQQLVKERNKDGDTPLFVAIDHGHENVFDYLSYYAGSEEEDESGYKWWRKNDATTILHVAILGEHFELASSIIRKYKKLCYARNEKGETPLQILATMPLAFRTGSPKLLLVEQMIYESTLIWMPEYESGVGPKMRYPPIYTTCVDLFKLLTRAIQLIGNCRGRTTNTESDQEEVIGSIDSTNDKHIFARPSCFQICKTKFQQKFPQKAKSFMEFLYKRLVINAMVGFYLEMLLTAPWKLGRLLFPSLHDIRRMARKHYWAGIVMQELVRLDDHYYDRWNDTMRRDPCRRISTMVGNHREEETKSTMVEIETESTMVEIIESGSRRTSLASHACDSYTGLELSNLGSTIIEIERESRMVEIERAAVDSHVRETPILIAARTGITEMVMEILEKFPSAIFDLRPSDQKNVMLIAVENRRVDLWDYFKGEYRGKKYSNWKTVISMLDKDENNALHIAATPSVEGPWLMSGEIMKLHWDAKWFEYVANNVPGSFQRKRNKNNKTPKEIFSDAHKDQPNNEVSEWLNSTASSCSLVASLIATVAYASAATIPGGNKENSGEPQFRGKLLFKVFLIANFIALCFSISSLICFLALLISRQRPSDYRTRLPWALLLSISTLLISIVAMLVSFCAGQFLFFKGHLVPTLLPIYIVFFVALILVVIAQFPFFVSLLSTVYLNKPQPCYRDGMVK